MSDAIREIPYNYTSCSDREIVHRFLGEAAWEDLCVLRHQRRTGRSARMLFEILGDVWLIERNPFARNNLLSDEKRRRRMRRIHQDRLQRIYAGAEGNSRATRVAARTERMLDDFYRWFEEEPARRKRARAAFARHTHRNNIHFDAFTLAHSATDATDWRHHHPFCVLTPDRAEELPGLVRAARRLGLVVIPRGGGTGLCGGSVPLQNNAVVVNLEKLDRIGPVVERDVGGGRMVPTITAGAGAVTGRVMEAAKPHIFATDPTSLWACTIGGNIASNAGGKHAVLWGTCVDNLLSWKMVRPDGGWLLVERLDHNLGRIDPNGRVRFRLTRLRDDGTTPLPEGEELLELDGATFRRAGLGKDVTRKALGGLPGVQKEGCDGFITEATFILHRPFACTRTVCCEFYDHDLSAATRAMVEIKEFVDHYEGAAIEGLEHFDAKYVRAIEYVGKSSRRSNPKVVLLIDISGDEERPVAAAAAEVCRIASIAGGEGFVAVSDEDRRRFWADRGRMAAIARHTRAFKLNEDVVIPLHRLADYSDFIERLNIEQSIANKIAIADAMEEVLTRAQREADETLGAKLQQALVLLRRVRAQWQGYLSRLDEPARSVLGADVGKGSLLRLIQHGGLRISLRRELEEPIRDRLQGFEALRAQLAAAAARARSSRLVIATHMHAGDGNVHTNIPVNSNDYAMMKQAHHLVERIMAKAVELGGVISGEHGIGITKLPWMNRAHLEEVADYLEALDPERLFNRGKLTPDHDLSLTYTPSFNLLEHEAMILEAAEVSELSEVISPCLRCGKCKPVCNTHFPRADLLYSPRNKIQAAAGIIEVFLYESQRGDGISFAQFGNLREVADHCTICHKCRPPCPVGIDFGEVTEKMRALLKRHGEGCGTIGSRLALTFLTLQRPDAVRLMRDLLIRWGYRGQRLLHRLAAGAGLLKRTPAGRRHLDGVQAQVIHFVERPLPVAPHKTARQLLGIESKDANMIPVVRDPERANGQAVFYFPGCGSERLYSQIAMASVAALFDLGRNVVLPPSYLCCGYPSTAAGDAARGAQIGYDNRVLFHRIRHALSYLDFEAVVVSCGTCFDQLSTYQLEQIFPDAPLIDIHEYLVAQGVTMNGAGTRYLYHEPCHTPMKRHGGVATVASLLGDEVEASPDCCGEAGTMAVATPAIAGKIRARKEERLAGAADRADAILTSCPSCLQGLGRLEQVSGLAVDYPVVELMRRRRGKEWQQQFRRRLQRHGVEWVLM
ncbi:MAG: DUF3683 domain-containing protein [Zetaproteobacteria bacterium]|nr:MAG: DUF3683 domain-containing protein [Zetaproteobacteria bacterium]